MAPITTLLFCYRQKSLTMAEFRQYCEEKHVPLVKSLLGIHYPQSHTRFYIDADNGYVLGKPTPEDPDLLAIVTYENEEKMQASLQLRRDGDISRKIREDEEKFMDLSRVKVVRIGENDVMR